MKRRDFLKKFGVGAGAAGFLAATVKKSWASDAVDKALEVGPINIQSTAGPTQAKEIAKAIKKEIRRKTDYEQAKGRLFRQAYDGTQPPILRIAHSTSMWAKEGLVKPGEFFIHNRGETTCTPLGCSLQANGYKHNGYMAMRFKSFERGDTPEYYTDPDSHEYIKIVLDESLGDHHCSYGPCLLFDIKDIGWVSMFCGNKSTRNFARYMPNNSRPGKLTSVRREVHSRGWVWYVPKWKEDSTEVYRSSSYTSTTVPRRNDYGNDVGSYEYDPIDWDHYG